MGGVPTENMGRAGWADAATIVPLAVYESYGSDEVLARQLGSMRRWVEHLRRRAGDGVVLPTEPLPVRRLARPGCARRPALGGEGLERLRGERVLRRARRACSPAPSASSATRRRAAEYDALADRVARGDLRAVGRGGGPHADRSGDLALEFDLAPADRRAEIAAASPRTCGVRTAASPRDSSAPRSCSSRCRGTATSTRPTSCCCAARRRPGSTRSIAARRRCGSGGMRSCPTAASTPGRWTPCRPRTPSRGGHRHALVQPLRLRRDDRLGVPHRGGLAPDADDPGYRTVHVAPRPAVGLSTTRSASIDTPPGSPGDRLASGRRTCSRQRSRCRSAHGRVLDLPVTADSVVTVDGAPAPAELCHGTHRIAVTAPAVATPSAAVPA